MSGSGGAAPPAAVLGLGLDTSGAWHHGAVQKSRALVHTYLHPPPGGGGGGGGGGGRSGRAPLRLPSLGAAARRPRGGSSLARLSLSEPSLLSPDDSVHRGGSSRSRRAGVLQKTPPPAPPPLSQSSVLLPCRSGPPQAQQVQSCRRPSYIHFSQAIQPGSRPRPVRRHSHNPALSADTGDLRPLATQHRTCSRSQGGEPLSVVGKPCVLSCGQRPSTAVPAAGPARTQLHVFLPTEAEGEEADSESVDEGFMDELDSKMTSLKLRQGGRGTLTYH